MFLLRLFLALVLSDLAQAEVVALMTGTRPLNSSQPTLSAKTITLEEGDLATALYVSSEALVDMTVGGFLVRIDSDNQDQRSLPVVTGPVTIRIANFTSINAFLATFSVKRANSYLLHQKWLWAQIMAMEIAMWPSNPAPIW